MIPLTGMICVCLYDCLIFVVLCCIQEVSQGGIVSHGWQ